MKRFRRQNKFVKVMPCGFAHRSMVKPSASDSRAKATIRASVRCLFRTQVPPCSRRPSVSSAGAVLLLAAPLSRDHLDRLLE